MAYKTEEGRDVPVKSGRSYDKRVATWLYGDYKQAKQSIPTMRLSVPQLTLYTLRVLLFYGLVT